MFGLATLLIVAVGVVLLAWVLAKLMGPVAKKDAPLSTVRQEKKPKKTFKSWIVCLVVAMILSIWSGTAALFFLLVLWIILQHPKEKLSNVVGNTEKSVARRIYTWLFISSIFTVPLLIYLLLERYSQYSTSNELVATALTPSLLHLPLLLGLRSKSIFVYRHTQQGILLSSLRAGIAAIAVIMGPYPYDGLWLFLLGNGSLWLFGSIWGWVQINHARCWWLERRGGAVACVNEPVTPKIESHENLSPEKYLESSQWYLRHQIKNYAKQYALEAFRRGDFEVRRQAVRVLDDLNEVEYF